MNIYLIATATADKKSIDQMSIKKIRGCTRTEDCVYFDNFNYLVYEITNNKMHNCYSTI